MAGGIDMGAAKAKIRLTAEEREFFKLINLAVFANPFGDERAALDVKIAGLSPGVAPFEAFQKSIHEIFARMDRFEREDSSMRLQST